MSCGYLLHVRVAKALATLCKRTFSTETPMLAHKKLECTVDKDKGPAHALIQEFSSGVVRVLTIKSLTTFFSVLICFSFYIGVP